MNKRILLHHEMEELLKREGVPPGSPGKTWPPSYGHSDWWRELPDEEGYARWYIPLNGGDQIIHRTQALDQHGFAVGHVVYELEIIR